MPLSTAVTILVVNDREADLVAFEEALQPLGHRVLLARSARDGLQLAAEQELALAIVDVRMPGMDGFEMVEALRNQPAHCDLPVIFATAMDVTPALEERVYALGAVDIVPLPVRPAMLRSKVAVFAMLHRQSAQARAYADEVSRAATREVHGEQERFRLLMDAVSDYALFFMDALGVVTEWTTSAERLLGYREADAVGRHVEFIFTATDRAHGAPQHEMEVAVERGQSRDERLHVRANGTELPVSGRLVALKDATGHVRGFAKIMRDASRERAVEESEARFRQIFESSNDGIWILDADATIRMANRRIAEILGYELAELIGSKKAKFAFSEDQPYIARLFAERRSGRRESAVEVRFRHRDGHAVWTLLSARPLYRDGNFIGALDVFTDVTARRQAEARFRLFFESSAAGHALIDPTTRRFLTVNRRFCEITGRREEELLNLTVSDITHPAHRQTDEAQFAELHAGRATEVRMEKRYVQPDGSTRWVDVTSTMIRDPNGAPEVQLNVVQDITARKIVEAELAESRTRLRLAVEVADLGVFYHDGATGELAWNEQMKRLLGFAAGDQPSLVSLMDRVHPEDRKAVEKTVGTLLQVRDHEREVESEFRVVLPDEGTRWVKASAVSQPRENLDGTTTFHVVGTVRDISAQKAFEAELQKQISQRTRELDDKSRQLEGFSYTIAHDLRAPLRAINGYADCAMEEIAPLGRPEVLDYLERIRAATRRLDALINDLLSYSRINQIEVTSGNVNLAAAVDRVLRELQPEIERRHAKVTVHRPIPSVLGEESIIEQVIINLLGNALKFTPPGQPPEIDISTSDGDGKVRVTVTDHGIGIASEYHQKIFKVFERLQSARAYPGTGIGLAIVARGMERLGGRYGVRSAPGKGSAFWIELKRGEP